MESIVLMLGDDRILARVYLVDYCRCRRAFFNKVLPPPIHAPGIHRIVDMPGEIDRSAMAAEMGYKHLDFRDYRMRGWNKGMGVVGNEVILKISDDQAGFIDGGLPVPHPDGKF